MSTQQCTETSVKQTPAHVAEVRSNGKPAIADKGKIKIGGAAANLIRPAVGK